MARPSLLGRLALLFLGTLVATGGILVVSLSAGTERGLAAALRTQSHTYAQYLAEALGPSSSPEALRQRAVEWGLEIFWKDPDGQGSTSGAPWIPLRIREFQAQVGTRTYGFAIPRPVIDLRWSGLLWGLPLALAVAVLGFWRMRRHLLPLRALTDASKKLAHQVWNPDWPQAKTRELQDLTQAFESMAKSLSESWNTQQNLLLGVSHELRSPLTRIRVALEFLPPSKIRQSIVDDVEHLDRMTGVLLDKERITRRPDLLQMEECRIADWVKQAISAPVQQNPIHCQGDSDLVVVFDKARLGLALSNLVENCRRYAPESPIWIQWQVEGQDWILSVEDRGPGLDSDTRQRWGTPFSRGSGLGPTVQGFGLGSSLVRSIAEAHGGSAHVFAAQPQGLRVEIRLPQRPTKGVEASKSLFNTKLSRILD